MRLLFAAAITGLVALGATPAMTADVALSSRITAATVFPSGAEISRIGSINVQQGEHTLIIKDLPAETITESVRVTATATGRLAIGSVDARKVFITSSEAASADVRRKELEDALHRLRDKESDLNAAIQAAQTQNDLIANLAQLPTRPAPAASPGEHTDWREILSVISSASADAQRAKSDAAQQLRDLKQQISDTQKELSKLAPAKQRRTQVKIFVEAAVPLEGDVTVRYQVRNASWTPFYDARLVSGAKAIKPKLDLIRRASITQRTGEPWNQVAITLSTTRPKAGAAAPELQPMTVDYRPEPRPVAMAPPAPEMDALSDMAEESRTRSSRSRASRMARKERKKIAPAKPKVARVVNAPFQALYQVPGRLDIPATGEVKRVLIAQETTEPKLVVRTVPKSDAKAYLYAKFIVPEGSPVLQGKVSLFRDGTFVGTGTLPVLASGEDHDLGFGIDDSVRVRYNIEQEKRGETGLISTSRTDNRSYKISVKNLHERAIDIVVEDQVPASKNQEIKVVTTGNFKPTRSDVDDRRGVVAWDFPLKPGEERVFSFGYRVTWPSERSIVYGR
ncbi:MAG: mucoidy inhibitor MuiA family protein [Alphaproteobacteria bacterium]|nr:mucoidy inhibitor MuiA family protein [Alphaproteobacteria bacterium]